MKCPVCDGTGRILSAETVAFRLERELLEHRNSDAEAVLIETTKEVKEAIMPHLRNGRRMDAFESIFFNPAIPPSPLCLKTIWKSCRDSPKSSRTLLTLLPTS